MKKSESWSELVQRWLPLVFPALLAHNKKTAQGDRGVLAVSISIDDMQRMMRGQRMSIDQVWVPADEFIRLVRSTPGPVSEESLARWDAQLRGMDPTRDVALFLSSPTKDDSGHFLTRFIVTHDGNAPVH